MCNTLANKKIFWEIWQYRKIITKMIRMLMMMSIMMQYESTQVNMSTRDGGGEMAMMIWWYSMMMMMWLCMQVNMRKRDGREGGDGQSRDGGKHASLLLVMQCHPPSQFCIFVFLVVLVCPFVVLYFCLYVFSCIFCQFCLSFLSFWKEGWSGHMERNMLAF